MRVKKRNVLLSLCTLELFYIYCREVYDMTPNFIAKQNEISNIRIKLLCIPKNCCTFYESVDLFNCRHVSFVSITAFNCFSAFIKIQE